MPLLRPIIVDDQNKRVRLASMLSPGSPSRRAGVFVFIWLPVIGVASALLLGIVYMVAMVASVEPVSWFIALFSGMFVPSLVLLYEVRWWRENGRSWLKHRNRCPACAYDLADAATDRFGNTICPECGATWKLRRPVWKSEVAESVKE